MAAAVLAMVVAHTLSPASARAVPPETEGERRARAEAAFEKAQVQYDLGAYDSAIALFQESYELSREPDLLFNVAQAHRLKGDCPRALEAYRHYVRLAPASPNKPGAQAYLEQLDKRCGRRGGQPPSAQESARDTRGPPVGLPARGEAPSDWALRIGGWAGLSVAVLGLGAAALFGNQARSLSREAGTRPVFDADLDARGRRAETWQWVSLGVAAGGLATAAVLWLLPISRPTVGPGTRMAVFPAGAPGFASLQISMRTP